MQAIPEKNVSKISKVFTFSQSIKLKFEKIKSFCYSGWMVQRFIKIQNKEIKYSFEGKLNAKEIVAIENNIMMMKRM